MKRCVQSTGVMAACLAGSFLLAILAMASPARASFCTQAQDVLPLEGGHSLVLVRNWEADGCDAESEAGTVSLYKYKPNGDLDPSWGEYGPTGATGQVRVQTDGVSGNVKRMPDGRILVVTGDTLFVYLPNGHNDSGFGVSGKVEIDSDVGIRGAAPLPDGRVAVLQQFAGRPAVIMIGEDGKIDSGFGDDGVKIISTLPWQLGTGGMRTIEADPSGRIVIAGSVKISNPFPEDGVGAIRLLGDGQLDAGFGDGGFAESEAFECTNGATLCFYGGFNLLQIDPDGRIRVGGTAYHVMVKGGCSFPLTVAFADDGTYESRTVQGCSLGGARDFVGGDLLLSGTLVDSFDGHRVGPNLFRTRRVAAAGDPASAWSSDIPLSPGEAVSLDAAYDDESDQVVSVGYVAFPYCSTECQTNRSLAIVRLNADTGQPVASFGAGGVVVTPSNSCEFGVAGSPTSPSPVWKTCRVVPPKPTGTARFTADRGMAVRVDPGAPPAGIRKTEQRLLLKMPAGLRLKRGGLKGRVRISASGRGQYKVTRKIGARTIFVTSVSDRQREDGFDVAPTLLPDEAIKLTVRILPGTIRMNRKQLKRRNWKLDVRGTFVPANEGLPDGEGWYASNTASSRIPVRK